MTLSRTLKILATALIMLSINLVVTAIPANADGLPVETSEG